MMDVTEAVLTGRGERGFPAVVDQAASKVQDDRELLDCGSSPFFVHAIQGQRVGTGAPE